MINDINTFDYIFFQVPLPDGTLDTGGFQTNSLDNRRESFVVDKEGVLCIEYWNYRWVTDEPTGIEFLQASPNSYRRIPLTTFSGDVTFYNKVGRTYTARFTQGQLKDMWVNNSE